METVIHIQGLTKYFANKPVVNRLSLKVPQGAIFALLGDNGAGKSTTIRMLTGLLQPDKGLAMILGLDCWAHAVKLRHRVGYVPERPRYYDWMTVQEIGRFAAGFHREGYRERYVGLLDRYGLEPGAKLRSLSKGGYARVGLALALASDPEVLILDEPTSGLDLFTRREFLNSMVDLAAEGRTILISSHGIAEIERVASHAAFVSQGQLIISGSLEELRERFIRVRVRHDGLPLDPGGLGQLLDLETSGKEWEASLLDPDRVALEDLRSRASILSLDENPMTLEEMYTALMAQLHRRKVTKAQEDPFKAVMQEKGGRS